MANPLKMLKLKPTGLQFIHELPVNAPPKKVWATILKPQLWFAFEGQRFKQSLDATPGGHWIFQMDGASSLMAIVTHVEPQKLLRLAGPMGLSHLPVTNAFIFELQPQNDGKATLLRLARRTFGFLTPDVKKNSSAGWKQLAAQLKAAAEK